jgi:hypothetical protein
MKKTLPLFALLLMFSTIISAQKLLEAVEAKNHKAAEQYIKEGENLNTPNAEGQFPLPAKNFINS